MNSSTRNHTGGWTALLMAALFMATAMPSLAKGPAIVPPRASYGGQTYAEWSAAWFQWSLALPATGHPLVDETGADAAIGQSGDVWFVGGVFNASGTVVRNITLPRGTALFFPVLNVDCSTVEPEPFYGSNEAELRACAATHMDATSGLFLEVDGQPVSDLSPFRVVSPLFEIMLPADNVLGVPGPASGLAVSDGVYVMLAPLSKGQHTLHFGGTFDEYGYTLDITYHISVQ
jgi:hypothetical protein